MIPNYVFLVFVIVCFLFVHSWALTHRDNISKTGGQFVFKINLDVVAKTRERSAGYFVGYFLICSSHFKENSCFMFTLMVRRE